MADFEMLVSDIKFQSSIESVSLKVIKNDLHAADLVQ